MPVKERMAFLFMGRDVLLLLRASAVVAVVSKHNGDSRPSTWLLLAAMRYSRNITSSETGPWDEPP